MEISNIAFQTARSFAKEPKSVKSDDFSNLLSKLQSSEETSRNKSRSAERKKSGEAAEKPEKMNPAVETEKKAEASQENSNMIIEEKPISIEAGSEGKITLDGAVSLEAEESLKEKLEELEEAIEKGDRESVEQIIADILCLISPITDEAEMSDNSPSSLESSMEMIDAISLDIERTTKEIDEKLAESLKPGVKSEKALEGDESALEKISRALHELRDDIKAKKPHISLDAHDLETNDLKLENLKSLISKGKTEASKAGMVKAAAEASSALELQDTDSADIKASPSESRVSDYSKVNLNSIFKQELNHNMHSAISQKPNLEQNFQNIEKLDIIEQISANIQMKDGEAVNEIKIKLTPETLGDLMVKITLERGVVNARAIVENPVVKQIIESNLFELKESLKSQGISFDNFEVLVSEDSKEQNHPQQNMHWKDNGNKRKRAFAEIDELDLEEVGELLEQGIINSERLDTTI